MSKTNTGKYVTQVTAEAKGGVAYIRIVDVIMEYGDTSSTTIREKVDQFIRDGITKGIIYLNSRGGNCFETVEIANQLDRFTEKGIQVGAVAASAATYLCAKFPTVAKLNSQFMVHRPRMGTYGDIVGITNDLKLLSNTTEDYKGVYAKKMGKTEVEIEEFWSKGDVWLTANEALAMGLIESIEDLEEAEISAQDVALLEACGAPNIPVIEDNLKNDMDKNVIIAALGLSADATDDQITLAIKKAKTASDLHLSAQSTAEEEKKTKAGVLVDAAIADKKIEAKQRAFWLNNAINDLPGTTAVLDSMNGIPKLSALLEGDGVPDLTARADWSFDKWQTEDPKGLEALAEKNPEEFNKVYKK